MNGHHIVGGWGWGKYARPRCVRCGLMWPRYEGEACLLLGKEPRVVSEEVIEEVARWFRGFDGRLTRETSLELAEEIIGVIDQERDMRGLVVVPREPTDAMVEAMLTEAGWSIEETGATEWTQDVFRAALRAAGEGAAL